MTSNYHQNGYDIVHYFLIIHIHLFNTSCEYDYVRMVVEN